MGSRSFASVTLVSIGLLALPGRAAAQQPEREKVLAADLEGQLGWTQGRHSGGVTLGASGRLRYRVLTAGLALQNATIILGSVTTASALAGLTVPLGHHLRLDALGEVGLNAYDGVGSNFLSDDPGTAETLGFVGGRASLLARVHRGQRGTSLWLGISGSYAHDLTKVVRNYSYRSEGTGLIFGERYDYEQSKSVEIGQSRWALLVTGAVRLPF
jgi:hypothetical protein